MKEELEKYIHDHIPLSMAMGIEVEEVSLQRVRLNAPMAPNINHKKTVFGGSLHAAATLTCWSLVFVNLRNLPINAEIVISSSNVKYLAPVKDQFTVECSLPNPHEWHAFETMLINKGKSRLKLNAKIYQNGTLALDYYGEFVALVQK
jgi:thioesterase domain-containing protein